MIKSRCGIVAALAFLFCCSQSEAGDGKGAKLMADRPGAQGPEWVLYEDMMWMCEDMMCEDGEFVRFNQAGDGDGAFELCTGGDGRSVGTVSRSGGRVTCRGSHIDQSNYKFYVLQFTEGADKAGLEQIETVEEGGDERARKEMGIDREKEIDELNREVRTLRSRLDDGDGGVGNEFTGASPEGSDQMEALRGYSDCLEAGIGQYVAKSMAMYSHTQRKGYDHRDDDRGNEGGRDDDEVAEARDRIAWADRAFQLRGSQEDYDRVMEADDPEEEFHATEDDPVGEENYIAELQKGENIISNCQQGALYIF